MSGPTTIALAHASVGSGHRIAAEAIAEQIGELAPRVRTEIVDVLGYGAFRVSGDTAAGAFTGPTAPLYDAVWGSAAIGRGSMAISRPLLSANYARFGRWLRETRPSAVVATHALAANLAVRATRHPDLARMPVAAAATDYGLHGYWPHHGLELFCVADEAERDELARRGSQGEVAVTGIPVRHQFAIPVDRREARDHFGFPAEKRVVLALAGATMPRPYAHFKASLAVTLPAIASLPDTIIAVVTGKDHAFAADLTSRVAGFGAKNVHVLGFVENMARVMAAADVAVCKPGGLVTAECVALGLPMVLVGPVAGQERANVSALARAGAAVYEDDPRRLAEVMRTTLARTGKLAQMRTVATGLARPDAARDIAELVLRLAHDA